MFTIISFCYGNKYEYIKPHWINRLNNINDSYNLEIISDASQSLDKSKYAWWDIVRMHKCIELLNTNITVAHIDMDIILLKDITPLVSLNYDFIISTEISGNKAFPKNCSEKIGFGVCSGFYIAKPSSLNFLNKIYTKMNEETYDSYSDQVTLMNYILNTPHIIEEQSITFDNKEYTNKIILIDNIKICVLDFNLVIRDPIVNNGQFANHINVDNIDGSENFIKYFYNNLEDLPLTCRCGKSWLGDTSECSHIKIRPPRIY